MSDKPRCDPFALIDRLVRGEITNEEAGILLAQVQKNDELAAAVRANYRADFLLALLLSARVDADDSFPILPVLPGETTMNPATNGSDDLWKSLETMVRYEREAVPVVRPASRTPSETAVTTTSLRAPFEPREKHAGDVIKSSPRFDFPFLIRVCLYFALITWLCLTTRPDDHL
ncbi:MAG: hypothetical protein PHQ75_01240, partial [Thermoguttaceae bacterium]|nr:hypothetical protein [Thermoguttaceae bacterium]